MMVSVPGRFLWKVLEAGRSWKLEGLGVCKVLAGSVVDSDDQQNKR
jgi:hypothetical protein